MRLQAPSTSTGPEQRISTQLVLGQWRARQGRTATELRDRPRSDRDLPRAYSLGVFAEVFPDAVSGGVHGILPHFPVRGADFPVLLDVLQTVEHSQRLVHIATKRQVVDHGMPDNPLLVDEGALLGCTER